MERANAYHERGFNCCQSVVAAFLPAIGQLIVDALEKK